VRCRVYRSARQCVAVRYSVLVIYTVLEKLASVLQCVAVRCSVSQCASVCCSALQRVGDIHSTRKAGERVAVRCSALQCLAVRVSVLQCVTACW